MLTELVNFLMHKWIVHLVVYLEKILMLIQSSNIKKLIAFVAAKLFGNSDLISYASTIDFRDAEIPVAKDLFSALSIIGIHEKNQEVLELLQELRDTGDSVIQDNNFFPESYNSGEQLRGMLYVLVRILEPTFIVEVGTGNAISTAVVGNALRINEKGKFISLDVVEVGEEALRPQIRDHIELIHVKDERRVTKLKTIEAYRVLSPNNNSVFIHDGDHSFFGQTLDYEIARETGFRYLVSDDVDASHAFLKFVKKHNLKACVLLDTNRLIGLASLRFE